MDDNKCLFCDGPVFHQLKAGGVMDERDCPQCGKYEFFSSSSTFERFREWAHRKRAVIVPQIKSYNEVGIRFVITLRMLEQDAL